MPFRTGPRRRGNPLALQTIAGIATPVCRPVRNDIFSFRRFVPIASFLCVLQQLLGLLANGAALLVLCLNQGGNLLRSAPLGNLVAKVRSCPQGKAGDCQQHRQPDRLLFGICLRIVNSLIDCCTVELVCT